METTDAISAVWGWGRWVYDHLLNRGLTRLVVAVVLAADVMALGGLRDHRVLCGLVRLADLAPRRARPNEPMRLTVVREEGRAVVVPGWSEEDRRRLEAAEREGRVAGLLYLWRSFGSAGLIGRSMVWCSFDWSYPPDPLHEISAAPLTDAEMASVDGSLRARLAEDWTLVDGPGRRVVGRSLRPVGLIHDAAAGGLVLFTFVLPFIQGLWWMSRKLRGNARSARGQCTACGYPLPPRPQVGEAFLVPGPAGVGVCPECGAAGESEGAAAG